MLIYALLILNADIHIYYILIDKGPGRAGLSHALAQPSWLRAFQNQALPLDFWTSKKALAFAGFGR